MNIREIWKNKTKILEGIKNSLIKSEHIEQIASERMKLCEACDLIDRKGSECALPGTQPCCGECGCKLSYKVRSLSSECPHPKRSRWNAILSEEDEDKFYDQINYNPDID
jgi:hypothetical protein